MNDFAAELFESAGAVPVLLGALAAAILLLPVVLFAGAVAIHGLRLGFRRVVEFLEAWNEWWVRRMP